MKAVGTSIGRFSELPLVVFTSLAVTGAGLAAAHPVIWALSLNAWIPRRTEAALIAALLGLGFLASLLHLGRPARALLAIRRIGRSPLSSEVAVGALCFAAALSVAMAPRWGPLIHIMWGLGSLSGLGLLLSLVRVYGLGGQPAWRGSAGASPLVLGMAFGLTAYAGERAAVGAAALALLALDGLLLLRRVMRLGAIRTAALPAYPAFYQARRWLLAARFAAAPLVSAALLLARLDGAALTSLAAGVALDRLAFYALALRQTTESEIARVEGVLRASRAQAGRASAAPLRFSAPRPR